MKNLSLFKQIVFGNIVVMIIFITIFIVNNFYTVKKQMNKLENEKIISLMKITKPVIAINFELGLESGYEDAIKSILDTHNQILKITLKDTNNKVLFEQTQQNIERNIFNHDVQFVYKTEILNINNQKIGYIIIDHTISSNYISILNEYQDFLFLMVLLFILALVIVTLFVKQSIKPLDTLKKFMLSYKLGNKTTLEKMNGENEIAIINNTTKEMLEKIELEVEKRIKYEKNIMHKNRLSSMGEMLDSIAHQWRQPLMNLNAILLNIDRAYELEKLNQDYIDEKISRATELTTHMSKTIDDFRSFLMPNKQKEYFDLSKSIEEAISLVTSSLKDIDLKFHKKNYTVYGHENEFKQVILSIILNSIEVFNDNQIKNKQLDINVNETAEYFYITISDNAGGIKDELLEKIFEPYFTTKDRTGGTGLGLYISKIIINDSMGGNIYATNHNNGAKFTIELNKENM